MKIQMTLSNCQGEHAIKNITGGQSITRDYENGFEASYIGDIEKRDNTTFEACQYSDWYVRLGISQLQNGRFSKGFNMSLNKIQIGELIEKLSDIHKNMKDHSY